MRSAWNLTHVVHDSTSERSDGITSETGAGRLVRQARETTLSRLDSNTTIATTAAATTTGKAQLSP